MTFRRVTLPYRINRTPRWLLHLMLWTCSRFDNRKPPKPVERGTARNSLESEGRRVRYTLRVVGGPAFNRGFISGKLHPSAYPMILYDSIQEACGWRRPNEEVVAVVLTVKPGYVLMEIIE